MYIVQFPWKKIKVICLLVLVRKLARVPLPLLWFGIGTTNIHKIVKSVNDNLAQDKRQNCILLRRYAIDWSHLRRDTHEPRHTSLHEHLGFFITWEKSLLTQVHEIEFLVLKINSVPLEQNYSQSSFRMSKFVKQAANINCEVVNVDWPVDINYSGSFTSKVQL